MDGKLIIEKLVDLSALNVKDNQVRRLFILTNGFRTLDELYQLCNLEKKAGNEIVQTLFAGQYVNFKGSQPPSLAQKETDDNSFVISANFIQALTDDMAAYVGPIASVLIESVISPGQNTTGEELSQILNSLADSLENQNDRKIFLKKIQSHIS
jgi:hypothetical protein